MSADVFVVAHYTLGRQQKWKCIESLVGIKLELFVREKVITR